MATSSKPTAPQRHAAFGASKAHRLVPCPGSAALCERLGLKDSESADARLGTLAHEAAARLLSGERYTPVFLSQYGLDIIEPVKTYVEAVRSRPGDVLVEIEMPISQITGEPDAVSTSDAIVIGDDFIEVHDYKHGVGVKVFADGNLQTEMYGLAALDKYDALFGPFNEVRMFIHQPRLGHVDSATVSAAALREKRTLFARTWQTVERLLKGGSEAEIVAHLTPGESQCKFCPARKPYGACPALTKYVEETMSRKLAEIDEEHVSSLLAVQNLNYAERIAELHEAVPLIEMFVQGVKAAAEGLANEGKLPGWKFVQSSQGDRVWVDEELADKAMVDAGLGEDRYKRKLLSPAQAEKVLKKDKAKWGELLGLITRARGSPSRALVKVDDPRPALTAMPDKFDNEAEDD